MLNIIDHSIYILCIFYFTIIQFCYTIYKKILLYDLFSYFLCTKYIIFLFSLPFKWQIPFTWSLCSMVFEISSNLRLKFWRKVKNLGLYFPKAKNNEEIDKCFPNVTFWKMKDKATLRKIWGSGNLLLTDLKNK